MPRNKNNSNPNQNKNHYHPRKHQHQNTAKNQSHTAGRDAAFVQKQQSEQQERLAKLLAKEQQEAEAYSRAVFGPVGVCFLPQFAHALSTEQRTNHPQNSFTNEVLNNPNENRPSSGF